MNYIYYNNEKYYYSSKEFNLNLYKHDENSDMRILIDTDIEPNFIISTNLTSLWKESVCLSKVIVFRILSDKFKPISLNEQIFLAIPKINNFKILSLELYSFTYKKIYERADKLSKPFILLDLDKTLILCSVEIETLQEKFYFKSDFSISNYTYGRFEAFNCEIMIRPGSKEFLEKLFEITDQIYIITAGDRNYAEEIIKKANRYWNVPIKYIFSMRTDNNVKLKSFNCIIPFRLMKNSLTYLAIDDNINAWEKYDQSNVIQILPFNTIYTNKYDILKLLYFIV
jgi:hypothetical protein